MSASTNDAWSSKLFKVFDADVWLWFLCSSLPNMNFFMILELKDSPKSKAWHSGRKGNSQAVTKMAHGPVKRTWSEKSYQSIKNGSGDFLGLRNQILVLTFRTFVAQPYREWLSWRTWREQPYREWVCLVANLPSDRIPCGRGYHSSDPHNLGRADWFLVHMKKPRADRKITRSQNDNS